MSRCVHVGMWKDVVAAMGKLVEQWSIAWAVRGFGMEIDVEVGSVSETRCIVTCTRLCSRGVLRRVRGAVGLLDNVGSTLGGCIVGIVTLGDCRLPR